MDPINFIIKHITQIKYEDLPKETITTVKKILIDTIGCGIAGSSSPLGKIIAETVRNWGGTKESSLFAYGHRVPAHNAAFANAIMARCLELDDVHEGNKILGGGHGGHIGVTIIPSSLALVESLTHEINGKQLILAIAVGGDLNVRLRMAAGNAGRIGWMTETISPFGIVASSSVLMGLNPEEIGSAMGAAYAQCSGNNLSSSDGTWDMWLAAGLAARAGLNSVQLSMLGYLGSKMPLSGRCGLYPLYFRNEYDDNILLSDLGKSFEVNNVSIKPYSSCKFTHHPIFTTLRLMKDYQINCERISEIKVITCSYATQLASIDENGNVKYVPRNIAEAQNSIPFTIATAIVKGDVFPDVLNDQTIMDQKIFELSKKVTVKADPQKDLIMAKEGFPAADIEIFTEDGKIYKGCEPFVKGHPQNPMSLEECIQKILQMCEVICKGY